MISIEINLFSISIITFFQITSTMGELIIKSTNSMKSQINHDLQELQFLCYILKTNASLLDLLFSESKFLRQLTYILKKYILILSFCTTRNFFIINESVQPVHTAISNVTEEFVWISMGFCFLLKEATKKQKLETYESIFICGKFKHV